MWQDFLLALALVLVIEGFLPAINPNGFRSTMQKLSGLEDRFLRTWGLFSMSLGAVIVYLLKS